MNIFYINSAFDFFNMVHNECQLRIESGERAYLQYYRGQANDSWGLKPSICRESCNLTGSFEKMIIQEFISRRPDDFLGISNKFNFVAKMQHYGLVTRLLDFTSNPAIALYFACCNSLDQDGEIFTFNTSRDDILMPKEADLIMDFYIEECNLEEYYNKCKPKYNEDVIKKVFYFIISNTMQIVLTDLISKRMVNQQSAFAIVPFESKNETFEKCKDMNNEGLCEHISKNGLDKVLNSTKVINNISDHKSDIIEYHQDEKRYIIKSDSKKNILRQLDKIGINESLIYPELYYEGKSIIEKYLYLTRQSE